MKLKQIILSFFAAIGLPAQAQLPYQDATLSAHQRAVDLCSRLTMEEKASLMMNSSPAIPRLGIPKFDWWSEALHGIARNGKATVFPQAMSMAASWDDALLYRVFDAVKDEAVAKSNLAEKENNIARYRCRSLWTPNINIFRDPRWGRGQETYGEDPYLTSRMGLAVVNGLQGQGFRFEPKTYTDRASGKDYYPLLACAKHFAVHSGPEWNRHSFNVEDLPARDLWETYMPAFKALVKEGNVREVMCAYQRLDGEPCCGNNRLLQQILRNEWGYNGLVVSDCGAISDFWEKGHHEVDADQQSSSAHAVRTGTDVECGSDYKSLPEAVSAGKVSLEKVDTSVVRLLEARFTLGEFDGPDLVSWKRIGPEVIGSSAHRQLALDMARETMTLLQNRKNILPLRRDLKIVVMGPNAVDSVALLANYNGFPFSTVTLLQGIQSKAKNVTYIPGVGYTRNVDSELFHNEFNKPKNKTDFSPATPEQMAAKAKDADVVIFCGGISPKLEGEEMKVDAPGFKGGDRTTIELPQSQRDVVKALHKMGKRVVFVNLSGGAMALAPETRNAEAILQAWYGGESAGQAVADVLFGDYNPGGKLPVTFYASDKDLPDFEDYHMTGRTYRYFKGKPLFPFGYGLSYTTFKYDTPTYQNGELKVRVSNSGKYDGDEVVQVYIKDPRDVKGPLKTLRAFRRIHLKSGESQEVSFPMTQKDFALWDNTTNTMRYQPGKYQVWIGDESLSNVTPE